jgi:hypothetical protein
MTLEQIRLYGEAIGRKDSKDFKTLVAATLYGAQCDPEFVQNEILQE